MAYIPTVWETGDIVTAEKLNKLEHGVADALQGLIVHKYDNGHGYALDKTWQEICDSELFFVVVEGSVGKVIYLGDVYEEDGQYMVHIYSTQETLVASTPDDYPSSGIS